MLNYTKLGMKYITFEQLTKNDRDELIKFINQYWNSYNNGEVATLDFKLLHNKTIFEFTELYK